MGVLRAQHCHLFAGFSAVKVKVICSYVHCEMLSSMAPCVLSRGDSAPGVGSKDCITNARRLWRAELGSCPRRRPTRRRASNNADLLVSGFGQIYLMVKYI